MPWTATEQPARVAGDAASGDSGLSLVLAGLILGALLLSHALVVRHVAVEEIPAVLRGRVERANRLRPWLFGVAGLMVLAGLLSGRG